MTQLNSEQFNEDVNYDRSKQLLAYLQQEIKPNNSIGAPDSLLFAYQELHSLVERLLDDNRSLWEFIKQDELEDLQESVSTNNFDLNKEQIKNILLKEIEIGQVFYPSDISDEYGLDLKSVVEVLAELKQQGHLVENPE